MPDEKPLAATVAYCGFRVGKRKFGVPVFLIKEVQAPTPIAPVPGAPPAVRGYVNLRGNLYLVLDPRELLTGESSNVAEDGHFIVFNALAGEAFAIQTDGVEDIVSIGEDQIDVPNAETRRLTDGNGQLQPLVTGHAKLEDGLMTLVEPRQLLSAVFHGSPTT